MEAAREELGNGKKEEGPEAEVQSGSEAAEEDTWCEQCREDGHVTAGEGYCVDCQESLCGSCLAAHRRTKLTRGHRLLDREATTRGDLGATARKVKDACVDICQQHRAEVVKYYCGDHGQFGCTVCVTVHHRNCKRLGYIPQLAEEWEDSDLYDDILKEMNGMRAKVYNKTQEAKLNLSKARALGEEAVKAVQELRHEVDESMDALEKSVRNRVEQIQAEDTEKMNSLVVKCGPVLQNIETILSEIETLRSSKKLCQLFVTLNERKGELEALRNDTADIDGCSSVIRIYGFAPTQEFKTAISSLHGIGKVSVVGLDDAGDDQSVENPDLPEDDGECIPILLPPSEDVYNIVLDDTVVVEADKPKISPSDVMATFNPTLSVTTHGDTSTCYISGCVLLPSGELVLADFNNSKIKVFDKNTLKLITDLKLTSSPWEVEMMEASRIAATLPHRNKIVCVALTETFATTERLIPVNGNCRGLVRYNDTFVVSFTSPPKLEIVDFHGNVIKTLVDITSAAGLMSLPYHITMNLDHEIIYISDCDKNKVIGLTMNGAVNSECDDLKYPRGMHVDHNGLVFVCARDTHVVHLVTPECRNAKVLLDRKGGLHYPMSACLDSADRRLFVGMEDDLMAVYTIRY